jgi:hypothetical protein
VAAARPGGPQDLLVQALGMASIAENMAGDRASAFQASQTAAVSPYAYASNDPLNNLSPGLTVAAFLS